MAVDEEIDCEVAVGFDDGGGDGGFKAVRETPGAGLAGPGCGVRVETAAAAAATEESIRERKSRR